MPKTGVGMSTSSIIMMRFSPNPATVILPKKFGQCPGVYTPPAEVVPQPVSMSRQVSVTGCLWQPTTSSMPSSRPRFWTVNGMATACPNP